MTKQDQKNLMVISAILVFIIIVLLGIGILVGRNRGPKPEGNTDAKYQALIRTTTGANNNGASVIGDETARRFIQGANGSKPGVQSSNISPASRDAMIRAATGN